MPETEVIYYRSGGACHLLDWLDGLPAKVQDKCIVKIERLEELGHELRRPEADFLRDGIHELRLQHQRVQYRMLYFFHDGRAVITHGIQKKDAVPPQEIDSAMRRMENFKKDPGEHTYREIL